MINKGLIIEDNGVNNVIEIDESADFFDSKIIIDGNDNVITIARANQYFRLNIKLKGSYKKVEIEKSSKNIKNLKLVSIRGDNQSISIGKDFSCGGLEIQMNDGDENCVIGDNCLFSWGIKLRTSDGHSVVDLNTNKAINLPQDVNIGDRVWVGEDVSFLKGSCICSDSVVGSHAVVTKAFNQPNCVIAGFPAIIVKENIKWDRRMPREYNLSF